MVPNLLPRAAEGSGEVLLEALELFSISEAAPKEIILMPLRSNVL
jgi:hypothetical protein